MSDDEFQREAQRRLSRIEQQLQFIGEMLVAFASLGCAYFTFLALRGDLGDLLGFAAAIAVAGGVWWRLARALV